MNTTVGRVLVGIAVVLAIIAITPALAGQAPSANGFGEEPDLTNTVCPSPQGKPPVALQPFGVLPAGQTLAVQV